MSRQSPNGTYWKKRALAAEAKVDSLMLEHCPDEMTPAQLKRWGKYQTPVPDDAKYCPHGWDTRLSCGKCLRLPHAAHGEKIKEVP